MTNIVHPLFGRDFPSNFRERLPYLPHIIQHFTSFQTSACIYKANVIFQKFYESSTGPQSLSPSFGY